MLCHLWFYVPEEFKEQVKASLFKIGAGRIGNYQHCSWETEGKGQYMPLPGSNPAIGKTGRLEHLNEYRVEMVFDATLKDAVVEVLKQNHPYEEPAYGIIALS